ncbi:MAG: hypothetical protein WC648_03535 [Candidatus Paceibacterota bacterium]|jgi:hypothetical protein
MLNKQNQYQDFFAPPKPHHHVSWLVVLIVILALIMFLGWLYSGLVNTKPPIVDTNTNESVSKGRVLSAEEIQAKQQLIDAMMAQPSVTLSKTEAAKKAAIVAEQMKMNSQEF